NGGRALLMLDNAGLIKVKDKTNSVTALTDVIENKHNFKFQELDAAGIPRSIKDVTIACINVNYALPAGLNPLKDAIIVEGADNPYVNIFVTTEKNFNDPRIKQIEKVYRSEENKKFILDHFKGSILSAW
ncbi:MAG: metal ABC transporter substrate-binding protein, partial [Acidaminococcaceae bacterium]|nr:metal ABC transporter substrate-binding protein [Acidaminococcaceae bacterium]